MNYVARVACRSEEDVIGGSRVNSDSFVLSDALGPIPRASLRCSRIVYDSLESFFQMLPIRRLSVFAAWKAAVNLAFALSSVLPCSP
jgi:hypothetical protein